MKNFNTNTLNNDEWLTPPYIIKALGHFDLDPCAPVKRPWDTATRHYSLADVDGLYLPWAGRVWLNPPYGDETYDWLDRLVARGSGIALIFARTETQGFHRSVWQKAKAVFFFEGRISFHRVDGSLGNTANAPSCLVSYSHFDTESISKSGLKGKLVII